MYHSKAAEHVRPKTGQTLWCGIICQPTTIGEVWSNDRQPGRSDFIFFNIVYVLLTVFAITLVMRRSFGSSSSSEWPHEKAFPRSYDGPSWLNYQRVAQRTGTTVKIKS